MSDHPAEQTTEHRAGCTGKRRHASATDAVGFASRMVKKTGAVRPYECRFCKGWHLTSETRDEIRRRQMALIDGILDDYDPALRELAKR